MIIKELIEKLIKYLYIFKYINMDLHKRQK